MPGRGPAPKDPATRARRNKDPQALRVLIAEPAPQPSLPSHMPTGDDEVDWPQQTRDWWKMWAESPLSSEFTSTDWSYLLDTALAHGRLWSGDIKAAPELRLRVAQFGATPVDRARLRITFAQADEADAKTGTRATSSRDRHSGLKLAK